MTAREAFIVGARSYPGNPYDGHTLADQLQQVETLTASKPETCFVDRGYKGSGVEDVRVLIAGQKRGVPASEKRWMRRRDSVEPVTGHLKSDGRMRRCFLKGLLGNAVKVLLCACGHNLRNLLWCLYFALKKYGLILHYLLCQVLSRLENELTKMVPAC